MPTQLAERRAWIAVAVLAMCGAWPAPDALHAQAAGSEQALYEAQRVDLALQSRKRVIDPQPEGKRIAFIDVVREEVFAEGELLVPLILPRAQSTWPNTFHWLTAEDVIRRELLLQEGDVYEQSRIDESERTLRELSVLALARIVAVRADDPDRVGLLVYTRDLWSLRAETAFRGVGTGFRLQGQLVERNLFGRHKALTARVGVTPFVLTLGELYSDRRLFGGPLSLSESLTLVLNREHGGTEGSVGALTLASPSRDLRQSWSWSSAIGYSVTVAREARGTRIATYRYTEEMGLVECLPDPTARAGFVTERRTDSALSERPYPRASDDDCLRKVWEDRYYYARASATYTRGVRYRQSVSFGAGFADEHVEANAETQLLPSQQETFEQHVLPRVRRQIYPSFSYGLFVPEYAAFENLGTFGQTENVRTGPQLTSGVTFPLEAFGSSTNSITFSGSVGYVLGAHDLLAEAAASGASRLEDGIAVDQSLDLLLRGATPPWLFGRFVWRGLWKLQHNDTSNAQVSLGGDTGLRGHELDALALPSANSIVANFEYRSRPFVFESVHFGGVLFYDVGAVYRDRGRGQSGHAVGAGLRLLFPQLNRTPFGIDFGVALEQPGFAVQVSYATEQAVPLTATDDLARAAGP